MGIDDELAVVGDEDSNLLEAVDMEELENS